MIGALAGDIIGRPFEMVNYKSTIFPLFSEKSRPTDDSILTIAVADAYLNNKDIHRTLQDYYHFYPDAGYGVNFKIWSKERIKDSLASDGNGSAMRVSSTAYLTKQNIRRSLVYSRRSAQPSHSGKDGIAGACAIGGSIFLALHTKSKEEIKKFVEANYYKLDFSYDELIETYSEKDWGYTCAKSVPYAIYCFLISEDFEDCIRKCVSIGGDTDTIAAMAGSIAEAYYGGVPKPILDKVLSYFKDDDRLYGVIKEFNEKYLPYGYDIK